MKILPDFKMRNHKSTSRIKLFCYYFSFLLLVSIQVARAQSTSQIKISGNEEWTLVNSTSEVKVYTKEFSCIDLENGFSMKKVLVKVENLTSSTITLNWDKKLYYDNECINCQTTKEEYHVNLTLAPNQKLESDCSENDKLNIFIEMIGRASEKLTSFEFINFTTSK
jgi:hypothetical protein